MPPRNRETPPPQPRAALCDYRHGCNAYAGHGYGFGTSHRGRNADFVSGLWACSDRMHMADCERRTASGQPPSRADAQGAQGAMF